MDITCEWALPAILGEGPIWVENEQAIYFVDIVSQQVHRYRITDGNTHTWTFDPAITSLAPRAQGGFIATVRKGFAYVDFATESVTPIQYFEEDLPGNRFNDGKLDAAGRFWSGTMDEAEKSATGVLYRLDPDLAIHEMDHDYIITNGPAFSPDGQTMYHNDTIKREIYAFDLAGNGSLLNKRVLYRLHGEEGYPDGLTVDADGNLWQCSFGGSRITQISPQGEVLQIIHMPVPNITSCTFGGPNLDTLYVTTAQYLLSDEQLEEFPLAGSLFSFKPGVQGLPTPLFAQSSPLDKIS
ncbi:SMP-30/gluconolactonase/LRE family protein [Pontibacter sp. G13]|uniref:SMP-30/gluconolactonase/LRE family protein n=1 Tax=Pontibacter sp. G13 TaxID=3074898 RepID=UPI002889FF1E|nr:SMP-30/gluconolactonase/LRE family protein [Pontibacter sp. G13]WNJ18448.1 SMP-30/gluconolactonase/LRE family protein [Pontibacter sp. G13]